jgi:Transcriptional activator of glycolytic enzymes
MKKALAEEDSPLDAKLESVLPGVHRWHQINNTAMKDLDEKVDGIGTKVDQVVESLVQTINGGIKELEKTVVGRQDQVRKSLANQFFNFASQLAGRGPATLVYGTEDGDSLFTEPNAVSVAGCPIGGCAGNNVEMTDADDALPPLTTREVPPNATGRLTLEQKEAIGKEGAKFTMKPRQNRLLDLWCEWHGIGDFADDLGGIEGRNERWKALWRGHLDKQQYSRTARVISGIKALAERETLDWEDAVEHLEGIFAQNKYSVYKLVEHMQEEKLLEKKAARGRKKKDD